MLPAVCLLLCSVVAGERPMPEPIRQPVPRREAFFGLHFDLHPQKTDTALGADITADNLDALLARVMPDYVQYDCKGHAGYTGYPTQVGWASPGIVLDSLAIWREQTRRYGTQLFVHYSGVWDAVAIEHHPEWARIKPDGSIDPNNTSVFGPYVDELLIPQLIEVARNYQLDGAWVDGECWAAQLDYSPAALAAWRGETGLDEAPRSREEPHWLEWKRFHRRHFERYLAHWVDAVHAAVPGFQITSNWAYTTFMPKPIEADLDYLSGDYSPTVSVDRARVEARYLASTGMPWDLLAWGFNWAPQYGHQIKPVAALCQEAAATLVQGGAFGVYHQPTRSGYVVPEMIDQLGAVADFCRARQALCHQSTSLPQVALLLSAETQFDRSDAVYTPYGCVDELEGALHALLELHHSVDILAEHQLTPRLGDYPLVVIPESYKLTDDFRAALLRYVEQGGSLLLIGAQCCRLFADELGVTLDGEPAHQAAELRSAAGLTNLNGPWQNVRPETAEVLAERWPTRDTRTAGLPAATLVERGRGRIAAVWGSVALAHFRTHRAALRTWIGEIVERLFEPQVTTDAPPTVELALRRTRDGAAALHLLNLTGVQRADRFLDADTISPVGPLTVRWRLPARPAQVTWEPDGTALEQTWADGTLTVVVPSLSIHGAIVARDQVP